MFIRKPLQPQGSVGIRFAEHIALHGRIQFQVSVLQRIHQSLMKGHGNDIHIGG